MDTVQFEPKISTDLQIDWRRQASRRMSDPFADLLADRLKKQSDADQHEPAARRHHQMADPVSGRPPRVVIAHARALRGEAKEIDNPDDHRLPDQTDCASDEGSATAAADTPAQDEAVETQVEAEVATTAAQPADPVATIVVVTQPAAQQTAAAEQQVAIILPVPVPAEAQAAAPEQADQATNAKTDGSQANADAATEQQAVAAMAEADLSAVAAALTTGQAAPTSSAESALAATPPGAAPAALIDGEQPLLQESQAPVAVAAAIPNAALGQTQPALPPMDIKLRPGTPTRAVAGAADPAPSSAPAPQSAQAHQAALLQPSATGELSGAEDVADPALATDAGPGWMTHLAQGADGKRADFVTQLKQHLQNLPAHEQVAVHIQRALREGTGKFSIQLSPAELGGIQVSLEIDEDKRVTAAVTVERPSTLELLQRDIRGLERALHNAGLTMEGGDLSFSLSQGSDQDFAQDMNQSAASAADAGLSDAQSEADQPDSPAAQVMDTAAGIVNLQV